MNYRKATIKDAQAIATMYRELAFHVKNVSKDVYWDFEDFPMDIGEQIAAEYINNEERCVIVAEKQDELVGMIMLEVIPCHLFLSSHQRIGYIAAGYVKEAYRRQGIMHKLEELSTDFFKSLSIKYVEVIYLAENKGAKEAWNALGYVNFRERARKCID